MMLIILGIVTKETGDRTAIGEKTCKSYTCQKSSELPQREHSSK